MKARDIMTRTVRSVTPNTPVRQIAAYLIEHGISAVPVIDEKGTLLGMVSEGDLQHRVETGTLPRRSWWLAFAASTEDEARQFKKSHGLVARDVMSKGVVCVTEDTELAEIADLLDRRRIKRVPVTSDGKVVGIVSRANLVRALAASTPSASAPKTDREIREEFERRLKAASWAPHSFVSATVADGVIEILGLCESTDQRDAVRILAEGVPGVRAVKDSLAVYRFTMVS